MKICKEQEFNGAKVTFGDNEEKIIRLEQSGDYFKTVYEYGAYTRQLKGRELQEAMSKLLAMIYPYVHDCNPLA